MPLFAIVNYIDDIIFPVTQCILKLFNCFIDPSNPLQQKENKGGPNFVEEDPLGGPD